MNWDYMKDVRTDEKVLADFKLGTKMQTKIIERLRQYTIVEELSQDEFKKIGEYKPDIKMLYRGRMVYVEIKYTKAHLHRVQWKSNQWSFAEKHGGKLLQVSDGRCVLINHNDPHFHKDVGYSNKPVEVFTPENWYISFATILL